VAFITVRDNNMAYKTVEVEVDCDLDDFDDSELIYELESRGATFKPDSIYKLYRNYITLSPEAFNKELKAFFREELGVFEY